MLQDFDKALKENNAPSVRSKEILETVKDDVSVSEFTYLSAIRFTKITTTFTRV